MCKLKYLWAIFFILQTLALNANAYCETLTYHRKLIENTPDGFYKVQDFYPTGEKRSEPFLLKDEKEAKKKIYTLSFCGLKRYPKPSIIEGKYITYFENGNKQLEGVYKEGIRIGIWRSWYETGRKNYEATYRKGNNFIGNMVYWSDDGLKRGEGQAKYIPNLIDRIKFIGYWSFWYWNKDGQLILMREGLIDENENMLGVWLGSCHGEVIYRVIYTYKRAESQSTTPHITYLIPEKDIEARGCIERYSQFF